jgi:hypothetical protein
MSHSKKTKRGRSLYLDTWHREGRRFVVSCALCGREGYAPSILEEGFEKEGGRANHEHAAVAAELMRIYSPLPLDDLGRCEVCARNMDRKKDTEADGAESN